MWFPDQQPQGLNHLSTCKECEFLGFTSDLLNQKHRGWDLAVPF